MAKYPAAGHSYIEVDDAGGVPRNLSPYVEEVEPLGRQVSWRDVTGLNDEAPQVTAGTEPAQEFNLRGIFDDTPVSGPDAVLAGIIGRVVTVSYGPAGRQAGRRKITGEFLCLGYQVGGKAGPGAGDGLVRFSARFRQSGAVVVTVW